ncbi:MAG: T9SS type A sorting domain-containing protein [Cytophagaceae bacterium]|nr:T9SS type A sorting domain-containing protein [Cytophagaceae bacterium]
MKKILLSAIFSTLLGAFAMGQSVITTTSYFDNFNDGTVQAGANDGWYTSGTYTTAETGGKLRITATNADQFFSGFGLYIKPATPIDITANKKLSMYITNNGSANMELRVDLKLVVAAFAPTNTNCPAGLQDTINANYGVTTTISPGTAGQAGTDAGGNTVVVFPGQTAFVTFNYAAAQFEYNGNCGGAWSASYYTIPSNGFVDLVGLYLVVNGGAGESWCGATDGSCAAFSGSIDLDNLKIGGTAGVAGTNSAVDNISSSVVYPNPASGTATVELNLKSSSDVKITLSDMLGREVAVIAEGRMSALEQTFDVSAFTKGLYTVNYSIDGVPAKSELLMVK